MNHTRTYGIEMEMMSAVDHATLARRINERFSEDGIRNTANSSGWTSNRDSSNRTVWTVKTDGSINTAPGYGYQVEITSPVLSGPDGLKALRVVCEVIQTCARVNSSCGLHIHHGVGRTENLRNLINTWLRVENAMFTVVPSSRRDNRYCRRWKAHYRATVMGENENVRDWFNCHIAERYASLNLESFWLRGTVEFRFHSGTIDYEKVKNWTVATQAVVDLGLAGKMLEADGHDGSEFTLDTVLEFIRNIEVSAPSSPRPVAGRYTRSDSICDALRTIRERGATQFSLDEILHEANGFYTRNGGTDNVTETRWWWRHVSPAMVNLGMLSERRGSYTFNPTASAAFGGTTRAAAPTTSDDDKARYAEAAHWLTTRRIYFNGRTAAGLND